MKGLLGILAFVACSAVGAQTCDLVYTTNVQYKGVNTYQTINKWVGLDANGLQLVNTKGQWVVDQASKKQDKGGEYAIDFLREATCTGGASKPQEGVRVEGLRWQEVSAVVRDSTKMALELVKAGDDQVAKGKKHPWK